MSDKIKKIQLFQLKQKIRWRNSLTWSSFLWAQLWRFKYRRNKCSRIWSKYTVLPKLCFANAKIIKISNYIIYFTYQYLLSFLFRAFCFWDIFEYFCLCNSPNWVNLEFCHTYMYEMTESGDSPRPARPMHARKTRQTKYLVRCTI